MEQDDIRLVMKTLAFRPKDVGDIEAVLERNENLDMQRVRRWVGMLAEALQEPEVAERLEQLLAKREKLPKRRSRKR